MKFTNPDSFGRKWQGPFPFTKNDIAVRVPDDFGVYQVLYRDDIAYIGKAVHGTSSLRKRLTAHAAGNSNWALARREELADYTFVFYVCDAGSASGIESYIINHYRPPYNTKLEYKGYIPSIAIH